MPRVARESEARTREGDDILIGRGYSRANVSSPEGVLREIPGGCRLVAKPITIEQILGRTVIIAFWCHILGHLGLGTEARCTWDLGRTVIVP